MKYVFFRDDDVTHLSKRYLAMDKLFQRLNVPISYAVIPNKLNDECVNYLNKRGKMNGKQKTDILQHGYKHVNNLKEGKGEFGIDRSYQDQEKDIELGIELMNKYFNTDSIGFVPPFHSYDIKTLSIVEKKFKSFSAKYMGKNYNSWDFSYIPIHINFNVYKNGCRTLSLREIVKEFISQTSNVVGICLHHEEFNSKNFEDLARFIKYLKVNNVKIVSYSDLLQSKDVSKMQVLNLTFDITHKCNLKCQQCNIWLEKEPSELNLTDIKNFFKSNKIVFPIQSVTLTGGEIFLNRDFKSIFSYLVKMRHLGKVKNICLVTNGYYDSEIEKCLKKIDELEIYISLDGMEEVHNKLRGDKESFQKIMNAISKIKKHSQCNLTLKYTINKQNVCDIQNVYDYCKKNNINLAYKFYEEDNKNYYHKYERKIRDLVLRKSDMIKIGKILRIIYDQEFNSKPIINLTYLIELIKYIDGKTVFCCRTPKKQLFIDNEGKVYPCVYMKEIGNLKDEEWDKGIYGNKHNSEILNGEEGNCPTCIAYHGYLKRWNLIY